MKILSIATIAVVVLVAGVVLAVNLTADDRAASARQTLERAADRFVRCYERDASYARCDAGTSKVLVNRARKRFALTMAVEFAATYTISRRNDGRLARSCQPRGSHCPVSGWRTSE